VLFIRVSHNNAADEKMSSFPIQEDGSSTDVAPPPKSLSRLGSEFTRLP
jgi:hypothetical protein